LLVILLTTINVIDYVVNRIMTWLL